MSSNITDSRVTGFANSYGQKGVVTAGDLPRSNDRFQPKPDPPPKNLVSCTWAGLIQFGPYPP